MTRTDYNLVVSGEGMPALIAVFGLLKQANPARMLWIRGAAVGECWEFDQAGWEWLQNLGLSGDFFQKYTRPCTKTVLQTPHNQHIGDYLHPENWFLDAEAYPALLRILQKAPNLEIREHTLLLETENTPENRLNLYIQAAEIKQILSTDYLLRLDTPISKTNSDTTAYFSQNLPAFLKVSLRVCTQNSAKSASDFPRYIYSEMVDFQQITCSKMANGQELWEFFGKPNHTQPDTLLKAAEHSLKTIRKGENLEILEQKIGTIETRIRQKWQEMQVFYLGASAYTFAAALGLKNILFLEEVRGLAWRLGLVLAGKSSPKILDAYELERKTQLKHWITWTTHFQKHLKTGFWAVFKRLLPQKWRTHYVETNLLLKQGAISSLGFPKKFQLGGFWQAPLRQDTDKDTNFARLGADKWLLIGFNQNPVDAAWVEHLDILALLGVGCIQLIPNTQAYTHLARLTAQWQDTNNSLSAWAKKNKLQFVLLRPDQTVFGVARNLEELDKILDDLVECVA